MSDRHSRLATIAKIMGRIQKLDKDVNWLVEQTRRRDPTLSVDTTMTIFEILDTYPDTILAELGDYLDKVDITELDLPRFAEAYHWFFTDLVASSDPKVTVDDQARKIIELNRLIQKTTIFRNRDPSNTVIIPTGDGNAIGFKDNPEKPLLLAIELHKLINEYNSHQSPKRKIEIRIGLSTGSVYKIIDLLGNHNVWGPGIIYARRVMDLGKKNHILANDAFAKGIQNLRPDFKKLIHLIGNYRIKHEEVIPIYNIYGNIDDIEIGTKSNPLSRRVQKSDAGNAILDSAMRFYYNQIELLITITDPKTMMAHHTLTWNLINQYEGPVERYFCSLEGDVRRDFPDLNVKVTDEDGKELQIISLTLNKDLKKEFYVKFNKPLKPHQKGRLVRLEYDWEEPERHHVYSFGAGCKKFRYMLTVPREMPIRQRVAQISVSTGEARLASIPAQVRYLKDRTEVEWIAHDIPPIDAYRFDW